MKHPKILLALFLSCMSFALTACEDTIEIIDGRIPAEYLSAAQPFMGTYSGSMEKRKAVLTVTLDGDRPVMTSSADLIGDCDSKIGDLLEITGEKKDSTFNIKQAVFRFHPNHCHEVQGRVLTLDFYREHGQSVAQSSILDYMRYEQYCYPGFGPVFRCEMRNIAYYMTGLFIKD